MAYVHLLAFSVVCALGAPAPSPCAMDVEAASGLIRGTAKQLLQAGEVCKTADKAMCAAVISRAVETISATSGKVSAAIHDCVERNTTCAVDISEAAEALAAASMKGSMAADDCNTMTSECFPDIKQAITSVAVAANHIVDAVQHCGKGEVAGEAAAAPFVDPCSEDVRDVLHSLPHLMGTIYHAQKDCTGGDKAECSASITEVVAFAANISDKIEAAVGGCAGKDVQCGRDITRATESAASIGDQVSKAVHDCRVPGPPSACRSDITAAGEAAAQTTLQILAASQDCRRPPPRAPAAVVMV